jgi:glyoxylase-like metal-dependent hydrolase (beta-lactamase superfamily II)
LVTLASEVERLRLGTFVRPGSETLNGEPRVEVVLGYLVRHPDGILLLDTGIGEVDPETEAHYRPARRDLRSALAERGVRPDDLDLVVNCHLHFDHCGGNRLLTGRPVLAQRRELTLAREEGYTMPELVDFPGAQYEPLDGESEVWPGVLVLPTPGHTAGHQSLAVRCTDGTVVLAGQAHDYASDFTADVLAAELAGVGATPKPSPWLARVLAMDPRRVLFAHDQAVWEPS